MHLQIPVSNTTVYMLHDHFVLLQKCLQAFYIHILSLSAYILEMHISSQKNKTSGKQLTSREYSQL